MLEKDGLIKQINKLMLEKIVEISIIIVLVGLSIPAWNAFAAKMNDVDIVRLEDCKLNFKQTNENDIDFLSIENNYAVNKSYKIYLETAKDIDPYTTIIVINNTEYLLSNFYSKTLENNLKFTLVDKSLVATVDAYSIRIKTDSEIGEYRYIFEESNNF